jgi:hypothetical protein
MAKTVIARAPAHNLQRDGHLAVLNRQAVRAFGCPRGNPAPAGRRCHVCGGVPAISDRSSPGDNDRQDECLKIASAEILGVGEPLGGCLKTNGKGGIGHEFHPASLSQGRGIPSASEWLPLPLQGWERHKIHAVSAVAHSGCVNFEQPPRCAIISGGSEPLPNPHHFQPNFWFGAVAPYGPARRFPRRFTAMTRAPQAAIFNRQNHVCRSAHTRVDRTMPFRIHRSFD